MLYNSYAFEMEHEVEASVLDIRQRLTDALQRLPENSEAGSSLRGLRASCREYLNNIRQGYHQMFLLELGKLRAAFGQHLAFLAVKYGIDIEDDIEDDLATILRQNSERPRADS